MSLPQGTKQDNLPNDWGWEICVPGTQMELMIPARLDTLIILGAVVREYCASLPHIFTPDAPVGSERRRQFGTGTLRLPGTARPSVAGFSHFVYSAELILQEAASNIIRHGYGEENREALLRLELGTARIYNDAGRVRRLAFLMELSDQAPPFDPTRAVWNEPDPLEPRESGYGIYLIRKLTDGFSYRYEQGRNYLRMFKYIESFS